MTDVAALKDEIKKLNARATQKKMDLHDLSEELPREWERILDVAAETFDAYKTLAEKRAELKALEKA
ncbi:CCE_0567 family metalloprotein [Azospirillum halopraeferens]|uniref:CCE_0567 family metalloprotein n=1 Tax=Azospirillum halopraeferens TaxID=34010 RepID=UPI00040BD775|nr:CCE_0567 family metalloprotein [Azospirillum halopraeferens]